MLGVLPSPLWGGVGGGGRAIPAQVAPSLSHRTTPTPAQRSQACAGCASLPACADPPHKGEGSTEFAARGDPALTEYAAAGVAPIERGEIRDASLMWRRSLPARRKKRRLSRARAHSI